MTTTPAHILFTFLKPENERLHDVDIVTGTDPSVCFIELCRRLGKIPKVVFSIALSHDQLIELQKYA